MKKLLANKNFLVLWFALLLGGTGQETYNLLPKHFELVGFAPETVGFVMSFTGLGGMLILILSPFFIDRFDKRRILTVVLCAHLSVPLLYFLPLSPNSLYFFPRLLQGAQITLMMTTFTALLSFVVAPQRLGQGYAVFGLMGQAGLFLGMNIGEFFYDLSGMPLMYLFTLLSFIAAIWVVRKVPVSAEEQEGRDEETSGRVGEAEGRVGRIPPRLSDFTAVFRKRELLPVFYWTLLLGFGFGFMMTFIPKIALSGGLEKVGPFFTAYPVTVVVLRLTVSAYFDRLPRPLVLIPPLLILPVVFLSALGVGTPLGLALVGVLYGLVHGVLFPVLLSIMMNHAPPSFRGRMSVVFHVFFNGGMFTAANIGGLLIGVSLPFALYCSAAFTGTGLLLCAAGARGLLRGRSG